MRTCVDLIKPASLRTPCCKHMAISESLPPPLQGRLVMRQRGNLRLLMNANLWPDMPAARMEGGKVGGGDGCRGGLAVC